VSFPGQTDLPSCTDDGYAGKRLGVSVLRTALSRLQDGFHSPGVRIGSAGSDLGEWLCCLRPGV